MEDLECPDHPCHEETWKLHHLSESQTFLHLNLVEASKQNSVSLDNRIAAAKSMNENSAASPDNELEHILHLEEGLVFVPIVLIYIKIYRIEPARSQR